MGFRVPRWLVAVIIVLPAAAYCAALLFARGYVLGWQRADSVSLAQVLPLAITAMCYFALIAVVMRMVRSPIGPGRGALLWMALLAGGVVLQLAATAVVEPYPVRGILMRQYSQASSGYFTIGTRISSVAETLATFATASRSWPIHPQNNPPGLPLLFWATTRVAELAPGLSAALSPTLRPLSCFDEFPTALSDAQVFGGALGALIEFVLATLVVLPLYGFVRRIAGSRAAWLAATLYPITACMLQWASRWDRTFPLVSIGGLWLIELLLTKRRRANQLAIGLAALVASGLFFTYKLAPVLLALGVYFLVRTWQLTRSTTLMRAEPSAARSGASRCLFFWLGHINLQPLLFGAIAFAAFWAFWIIGFRFDLAGHFMAGLDFHAGLDRPYWPWALYCALDLFNHIGLPLVGLAMLKTDRKFSALWLAFFITVGVVAGLRLFHDESGRILTWLAPLAIALAAIALCNLKERARLGIIGLAMVQIVLHISFLRVINYGIDPIMVASAEVPVAAVRTSIRFGESGEYRLLGYTLAPQLKPGEYSAITYYWQLDSPVAAQTSHAIFFHLADSLDDQTRIVNEDGKPMNWSLPTTCWIPGHVIEDRHGFRVDPTAARGAWLPLVGMYADTTGRRLRVFEAQRARGDAVELPTVITIGQ